MDFAFKRFLFQTTLILGFQGSGLWAITPQEAEFFEREIRPVLADQCFSCHGAEKQKAELRLDSREAILKGSDGGAVAVLGKPEESSLIKSVRHEGDSKMPAKADKLSDAQIAALSEWVRIGLPWPDGEVRKLSKAEWAAQNHWSFKPVARPEVPDREGGMARVINPIDAFLGSKLKEAGLKGSALASRRTLIRRLSFDLTGLPPTMDEVLDFENDPSGEDQAYAKVVNRLLGSPRYGERWGRHWLDVARYADTRGYLAGGVERRFPFSYTYRDWVISAFNGDMPYNQFLERQIAADQLGEGNSHLAALGFLTVGRRFGGAEPDVIDDRIDVVTRGLMGLTTACARCHDHKFDPISQKDYYALYGVFASCKEPEAIDLPRISDEAPDPEYVAQKEKALQGIRAFYARRSADLSIALGPLAGGVAFVAPTAVETLVKSPFFTTRARNDLTELKNKAVSIESGPLAPSRAMVLTDKSNPVNPRVFIRGNPARPGESVPRRFLAVLSGGDPKPFTQGSGRLELAKSVTSQSNPLTARVFVNRVWLHHFGAGLVRTPADFGTKGDEPTHPALLDWLSHWFVEHGWSVKELHRLMVQSAAYRQVSEGNADSPKVDPENRLLWRMNRKRLEFEGLRDSLLYVTGELDTAMAGRPVDLDGASPSLRRSIYGFIDRQNLPGFFRIFDFANPDTSTSLRHQTTVPQQALFMMNSPFIATRARVSVSRSDFARGGFSEWQVQDLYHRVFARDAAPWELESALAYLSLQAQQAPEAVPEPVWSYGVGGWVPETGLVTFQQLSVFGKNGWQAGATFPDKSLGFAHVNATGGHAGRDSARSPIRRWNSPGDGVVKIEGTVERKAAGGDGIVARVISSAKGLLGEWTVAPGAAQKCQIAAVEVHKGECIDFIVDPRANDSADGFNWEVEVEGAALGHWNSKRDFSGPNPPPKPLSPWEKYAQALLSTNEFTFVD
jgi:cytochrome c553